MTDTWDADRTLNDIRLFLQNHHRIPLEPPHGRDTQPHPSPDQRYGTIILPLLTLPTGTDRGNLHWPTVQSFLEALTPLLYTASEACRISDAERHDQALRIVGELLRDQDPRMGVAAITSYSCFETVRLSVNLALDAAPLRSDHGSQVVAVAVIGDFSGGNIVTSSPLRRIEFPVSHGGIFVVGSTPGPILVQNMVFEGERYQLEFFLPDLSSS
ncbi:hypothetical protein MBM_07561 [Drepanopeziza brunnea f. sp. 'multigermtubi' MB_m1]|uniref:Uncharacterized protein n=2 Tax=Drepanopeziza brunnea f. sp. 'multigermtubi' TaxID=698441 RepID=K1WN58_MARBU|nr:uncharacterized protein MBM_07561 [Drepanopeziza brunnea f. sp. 'multigermtubi' MB_m1]EKD14331.1 hypothetical protein MBM_07561 [Drepanopeziza brunnea f. sp. 'multigermtubi' MB_m1]